MHHLYLGLDPVELGGAPFALTVDQALDTPARDLGLAIAPGACRPHPAAASPAMSAPTPPA